MEFTSSANHTLLLLGSQHRQPLITTTSFKSAPPASLVEVTMENRSEGSEDPIPSLTSLPFLFYFAAATEQAQECAWVW